MQQNAHEENGIKAYIEQRLNAKETTASIINAFGVEPPWLSVWLTQHKHSDTTELGLGDMTLLLGEWVASRRELIEAEELCCAAIRGDAAQVSVLLSKEDGAAWDAEDRIGVTAGEYALYLGHDNVLRLLVDAGVSDYVARFNAITAGQSSSSSGSSELGGSVDDQRCSWNYLSNPAEYDHDGCLLDGDRMPVMMPWEGNLMEETARYLVGPRVLNVGFGCGLVDGFIQKHVKPLSTHAIIEPHPDVLAMLDSGDWAKKEGVSILRGTWQQVLASPEAATRQGSGRSSAGSSETLVSPSAAEETANPPLLHAATSARGVSSSVFSAGFDSVFYDTHDEGVAEFIHFARKSAALLNDDDEHNVRCLDGSRKSGNSDAHTQQGEHTRAEPLSPRLFSFWNGMEFHNAFRHGVYCQSVRAFLCDSESAAAVRFERVDFVRVPVSQGEQSEKKRSSSGEGSGGGGGGQTGDGLGGDWRVWAAKGLRYWHLNAYYLPLCWKKRAPPLSPPLPPPPPPSKSENGAAVDSFPCIVQRADLCEWMVAGIRRGVAYHGLADDDKKAEGTTSAPGTGTGPRAGNDAVEGGGRVSSNGYADEPNRKKQRDM
eukprot:CAMPEP_0171930826 /NCGR_PEP_ID=MMETSP0993-20121228/28969_1 /TAXON_ID=483369 /ORGANISM="non described non described, Strain CCMP2098" /LENGTH=599 /DNA_ID=CAMNT_0012570739 /DNA_START=35 /DNA_END=1834 /DNA_ORIENTATION=+